jgi:hypothetical protein
MGEAPPQPFIPDPHMFVEINFKELDSLLIWTALRE